MKTQTSYNTNPHSENSLKWDDYFLSLEDLAEIFKVRKRTIQNWQKQGIFPKVKIQGKVGLSIKMLKDFILEKGGEL